MICRPLEVLASRCNIKQQISSKLVENIFRCHCIDKKNLPKYIAVCSLRFLGFFLWQKGGGHIEKSFNNTCEICLQKKQKKIHPMRCIRNLYLYQEPSFVKMDQNPLNIVSKTLLPLTFSRERLSCQNSVVDTTWTTKSQTKTCAVRTTVTIRLPVVVVLSFRRRCLSSLISRDINNCKANRSCCYRSKELSKLPHNHGHGVIIYTIPTNRRNDNTKCDLEDY